MHREIEGVRITMGERRMIESEGAGREGRGREGMKFGRGRKGARERASKGGSREEKRRERKGEEEVRGEEKERNKREEEEREEERDERRKRRERGGREKEGREEGERREEGRDQERKGEEGVCLRIVFFSSSFILICYLLHAFVNSIFLISFVHLLPSPLQLILNLSGNQTLIETEKHSSDSFLCFL
jgi:hypothetical protein